MHPVGVTRTSPALAEPTVIHLGALRTAFARGLLLLAEVVAVPGALLYAFAVAGRPMLGLVAVFAWRVACIGTRLGNGSRVPATCWLAFALFLTRTAAGLAVSSVALYLVVPVALCAAQALFFIGSSATRRPVMMRLAADYAGHLPDHPALRRLFAQLSTIWGGVHLVCAGAGAWALTLSTTHAVAVTSGLGLACTLLSVGGSVGWGLWRGARIPDVRITYGHRHERSFERVEALPVAA